MYVGRGGAQKLNMQVALRFNYVQLNMHACVRSPSPGAERAAESPAPAACACVANEGLACVRIVLHLQRLSQRFLFVLSINVSHLIGNESSQMLSNQW